MAGTLSGDGVVLIGRSSSHFTRVARIFAEELGVPYEFQVVTDLLALAPAGFGGNPALRVPMLKTGSGDWFGSIGICRELARCAARELRVVWPEQLRTPLLSNAQELVLQAMATEVELIVAGLNAAPTPHLTKRRAGLEASVGWLNDHVDAVLAMMPERDLSFLETTLFCLAEHLSFREVLAMAPFERLAGFARIFAQRPAARATPFAFDVAG
jgi:glutathione S-transferase